MKKAPIPKNEARRLAALKSLNLLDTEPEPRFDNLTKKLAEQLNAPIATLSLLDKNREWFKSCQGVSSREGDRGISFCGHAMLSKQIFIVEDTLNNPDFADTPYVVGPPHIRFYAGVALREKKSRLPIGVLCIKDTEPRKLTLKEIDLLLHVAKEAEVELNRSVN